MPRIKTPRKLSGMPFIKGFRPYGPEIDKLATAIMLHFEEYEAFKLCDYEGHNHHDAAKLMQVSRPTFTRIYAAARNKIATAFAEGRSIEIEGGSVYFDSNWFQCIFCGSYFNQPDPELPMTHCPLCGSQEVQSIEAEELNTLPNTK